MRALGDEGRGDDGGVAGPLDMAAVPEQPLLQLGAAGAGLAVLGVDLDAGEEADAADVADDREVAQDQTASRK